MGVEDRILEEIGKANAENRNVCMEDLLRLKICARVTLSKHIRAMIADGKLIAHVVQMEGKRGTTRLLYVNNGERGSSEEIIIRQNDILIGMGRDITNKLNQLLTMKEGKNGENR